MKSLQIIGCIALSYLALAGCQKKEVKNSPRCIYDQTVFAKCFETAACDDVRFAQFKRDPFFNLLWENLSKEEGEKWLRQIESEYPLMVEKFDRFKESDKIGSPRVYDFGKAGEFSPTTLRFAAIAGDLKSRLGSWSGQKVVQIGAGYGGLCRILSEVDSFGSYTLVDLPSQLALAKKYLEGFGIQGVLYLTPEELPKDERYDLVVSDMAFSEYNRSYQELFFDRVLSRSRSGFLIGHVFPKHFGVVPLSIDEIKGRFDKNGKFLSWEFQEPTIERENYFIFWKLEV
ncbi:MAG: putative sugar O-methyltransferase [Verrucomicrobia bacterium]|nr:putative sugar O-methyltransferase [Verrucomicrobiota bacterium]